MAQIQVNLEGVPVAVENRKVPTRDLKLDAQNPRIGLYTDSQLKASFSDEDQPNVSHEDCASQQNQERLYGWWFQEASPFSRAFRLRF